MQSPQALQQIYVLYDGTPQSLQSTPGIDLFGTDFQGRTHFVYAWSRVDDVTCVQPVHVMRSTLCTSILGSCSKSAAHAH